MSAGGLVGVLGIAGALFASDELGDARLVEPVREIAGSPEAPATTPPDPNLTTSAQDPLAEPASANSQTTNTSITFENDTLTFRAAFLGKKPPSAIETALRKETQTYLQGLREELSETAQPNHPNPWEVRIAWTIHAASGDHVAVLGRASEYRGGAHPNDLIDARMMSAKSGEKRPIGDYFKSRAWPTPAIAIAACEALKRSKLDRIGSATIFDDPITCAGTNSNIKLEEAQYMFAPSSDADHFGGLHILFHPYIVGAYSEGAYELTIPHEVFTTDLKPIYEPMFAGEVIEFVD